MHDEKQSNLCKYGVLWKPRLISICVCFGVAVFTVSLFRYYFLIAKLNFPKHNLT